MLTPPLPNKQPEPKPDTPGGWWGIPIAWVPLGLEVAGCTACADPAPSTYRNLTAAS